MWKLIILALIQGLLLSSGQVFLKFALMRMAPFGWNRDFYPMISLSYVMGMIAAICFFHEEVSIEKWIGVLLIMGGCILIAK